MDGNPLLSVVVPIYKVEKYLRRCIDSIIKQTYQPLEIILVDDGSPDGCGLICDEYAKKDPRIIAVHQQNKGLAGARNTGIERSSGAYIAFVDSDDYIDSRMYEKMLATTAEYDADITICGRYHLFDDGSCFQKDTKTKAVRSLTSQEAIITMNSFSYFDMSACDKLFRKSLFDTIRFPEGRLCEDFFVMYRLFDSSQKIVYLPDPLYYYYQRPESISRTKNINFDFIEAGREQMEYVSAKYPALTDVVNTAFASANMTVYNFHLKNRVRIKYDIRRQMRANVKANIRSIMNNPYISAVKKIQAAFFCISYAAYNVSFYLFKSVKRV